MFNLCLDNCFLILSLFLVMARLKTCSLNVNGMQDASKRLNIFKCLKKQNSDIFLLQEVHLSNSQENDTWTSQWGGPAFWSYGSNYSRGVTILFNPKSSFYFNSISQKADTEGRVLSLSVNIESITIKLVNVYAPKVP